MGENLVKTKNVMAVWENLDDVRAQFAPTLTEKEFSFFVSLGKAFGANPFLREIWAIKYDKASPASIFLGRDMYRRRAQEIPEYNGHTSIAVYEKDSYTVVDGVPKHSYSGFSDRGKLVGAYYIGWSKKTDHPFFVSVRFDEYNQGFALWKSKPETQIKKVAEAQGLRGQYQGVFAGTYDESEQWAVEKKFNPKGDVKPPPMKDQNDVVIEATATVIEESPVKEEEPHCEPERAPEPEEPPYTMVRPGETEPPDDDRPVFANDIYGRLDEMVYDKAGGNPKHMESIYETITGFIGTDGKKRYCRSIEQIKKWKPGAAEKAKRKLEEYLAMGTKFRFEE